MHRWHPVSVLSDIHRGEVAGVRIGGHEIVLWREDSATSTLHAWEDRCPHRGMRLSFGFVRGDGLGCLYHGWQFGAGARCKLIPAHPQVRAPASIHVGAYGVREWAGLAWVSLDAAADFAPQAAQGVDGVQPVRSVHVHAGIAPLRQAIGMDDDTPMLWTGRVGLAVHEPVAGQAMLHVVRAEGDGAPSAPFLSHWAARLRDAVECGGDIAAVMEELA